MRKMGAAALVLALFLLLACGAQRPSQDRPFAGIALTYADDSLMQKTADAFTSKLEKKNYQTQVVYCEDSVELQLRQIENFITAGAELIAVSCAGNSDAYEELFAKAQDKGCRVLVMGLTGDFEHCDVQAKSNHIFQGMRMCELLTHYLDQEYPGAAPGSVMVLFLEMSGTIEDVRACAGYRLIKERFLRYYDGDALDFIHADTGDEVYYLDGAHQPVLVDEPAGGLILDENGYAQLNPFYDARVDLRYAANRNISTNLEGQAAVDAFMATADGHELRIIISYSGEAAIGADEKLLYYQDARIISTARDKLAVFGSGDTQLNRSRCLASVKGGSLLRGFVCGESVETKVERMLDMLFSGEKQTYSVMSSSLSQLTPDGNAVGLITVTSSLWQHPEIFFARMA